MRHHAAGRGRGRAVPPGPGPRRGPTGRSRRRGGTGRGRGRGRGRVMTVAAGDVPLRGGRPRDPACDAAILRAAVEVFVECGYAGVSMEGVAARAGVGKATIYRRYASKAQLVVDAVRCGLSVDDHLPDTGDL